MANVKCRGCRKEISEKAMMCPHCGCFVVAEGVANDPSMRHILPGSDLSGWAIAAGYLGLISLLMIPAPFAILTGAVAIRAIGRDPAKRGLGRAWFGLVMGMLGTIGLFWGTIALIGD